MKHLRPPTTLLRHLSFSLMGLLLATSISHAQWAISPLSSGGPSSSFASLGDQFYVGTDGGGALYRYSATGTTWTEVGLVNGMSKTNVNALAVSGTTLFAGNYGAVFRSTDSAASWTKINTGLSDSLVRSLLTANGALFAGTDGGFVFRSSNNGDSWSSVSSGLLGTNRVYALAASGSTLFAGTGSNGLFTSSNSGDSWTQVTQGLTASSSVYSLAIDGAKLYAGTGNGVYLSTDGGATWEQRATGLNTGSSVRSLLLNGSDLYAGTGDGVFLSTDSGDSWTLAASGMPANYVRAMGIHGTSLFAAVSGEGLYSMAITNNVVANTASAPLPGRPDRPLSFASQSGKLLGPGAEIGFSVAQASRVTLNLLDLHGNLLTTLLDSELAPGKHSALLPGMGLTPGVYYLQLQSPGYSRVQRIGYRR